MSGEKKDVLVELGLGDLRPYLRSIGDKDRIFPKAHRIEVVFLVRAANYLLLRTEGAGTINMTTLEYSGGTMEVPVIQPQKLMAVTRRQMLQLLREYRDSLDEVSKRWFVQEVIRKAKDLGFKKVGEEWNCTIQPPLAESGEKATDIGMDGFCPHCTIFGAALTEQHNEKFGGLSIGIKTRVRFDPAFATQRRITPETHNKVTEGHLSMTGQALFSEVHVEPGTVFIGRAELVDLTEPELVATLYSLATLRELGGRSGIYGTVRVEILGVKAGKYASTTAYDLAAENAGKGYEEVKKNLKERLEKLGFTPVDNSKLLAAVDHKDPNGLFKDLWRSSIDFAEKMVKWVEELKGGGQKGSGKKSRSKKAEPEESEEE